MEGRGQTRFTNRNVCRSIVYAASYKANIMGEHGGVYVPPNQLDHLDRQGTTLGLSSVVQDKEIVDPCLLGIRSVGGVISKWAWTAISARLVG